MSNTESAAGRLWRWVRARAMPRRTESGEIIRWYGTVEDIDDHKKAEEALRDSEALLQASSTPSLSASSSPTPPAAASS